MHDMFHHTCQKAREELSFPLLQWRRSLPHVAWAPILLKVIYTYHGCSSNTHITTNTYTDIQFTSAQSLSLPTSSSLKPALAFLLLTSGDLEPLKCPPSSQRGPRWASVNLGIFICMQCSGIHRSLGVHISKVRSATLDTWLPDQIAFIQSMGNEKSNSYWEAELPPKYDRVGIENVIRAKYVEKRWIPRNGKAKSPSTVREEKVSVYKPGPGVSSGVGYSNSIKQSTEDRKGSHLPNTSIPAAKRNDPVSPKVSQQVTPDPTKQEVHQKAETAAAKTESGKQGTNATSVSSSSKVDYATDLFNLLSMEDSNENKSKPSIAEDNTWAVFQSAERTSTSGETVHSKSVEIKNRSNSGIEELFEDLQWVTPPTSDKPAKEAKNGVMNLFDKSNIVSPYSVHQQQLSVLAQQQTLFMAAATKPFPGSQTFHGNINQHGPNGVHFPSWNQGIYGNQVPGMMMPMPELRKHMQMGNIQPSFSARSAATYPTYSMYTTMPVAPLSHITTNRASTPSSKIPAPSAVPAKSGGDYDFSSLMQGMFTKR